MRILSKMLLSGLALALPFSAFSDDSIYISECLPATEEEAECYCHYIEGTDWAQGFGATYEEAVEDSKNNCKAVVRFILTEKKGFSETEADQYDYSPHITNQCRPNSCLLERERYRLELEQLGLTD